MKVNFLNKRILAGALALAVALPLMVVNVAKADNTLEEGRVDYYTFDSQALENKGSSGKQAVAFGKSFADFDQTAVEYVAGRSGDEGDYAIDLSKCGLKLNDTNIGDVFTVSVWVKPTGNFTSWAQNICFLGYHNPEKWTAIAGRGEKNTNTVLWSHDTVGPLYNGHTQHGSQFLTANDWNNVILVGDGKNTTLYINGIQTASAETCNPLTGEYQDVHVGLDNWDDLFPGYADDIMVYNRVLTNAEINQIVTGKSLGEILKETQVSVDDVEVVVGRQIPSSITVNSVVLNDSETEVTYKIDDEKIATVDADGLVTGLKEGETTLEVTVKAGGETCKATAKVTVSNVPIESFLVADYSFEDEIVNAVENGSTAAAKELVSAGNWADYNAVKFSKGYDGQGVQLNGYGLKMNVGQLGNDFTVSFGVKTDKNLVENQVMMMLGQYNPENWFAISGANGSDTYKAWENGGGYKWVTQFSPKFTAGQWSQVTLVGTNGKISLYVDGKLLGTKASNNPMSVAGADVYFGVNNWDTELDGCIDNVKIYNIALTESEVVALDGAVVELMNQAALDEAMDAASVLGNNESASAVKFDLTFPGTVRGQAVKVETSDADVISAAGKVTSPVGEDKTVTVTVSFKADGKTYEATRVYVVKGLDRSQLDNLLAAAKAVDATKLSERAAAKLAEVIAEGEAAASFKEIEDACAHIEYVLNWLEPSEIIVDPFKAITEPAAYLNMTPDAEAVKWFTVPEEVAGLVDVSYSVLNAEVVTFEDGVITPVAEGKTIVTALVTSKYDGYKVEYSTAVTVAKPAVVNPPAPSTGGSTGGATGGDTANDAGQTVTVQVPAQQQTTTATTRPAAGQTQETVIEEAQTPLAVEEEKAPEAVEEKVVVTEETVAIDEEAAPAAAETGSALETSRIIACVAAILIVLVMGAAFIYFKGVKVKK